MFTRICLFIATATAVAIAPLNAHAQDAGALLDLLVKKRIITDQEAEEVRSELTKSTADTAAGKWKLSQPITEIELYGDVRTRYEVRTGEVGAPNVVDRAGDNSQRNRARYRLRLGLRGTLADDWFFGLRLETSQNPRSTNVTFGGDSGSGPFAKNDDGINVGQAYLGYKGFHDITLTAGRMPNPLVVTSMVWDGDINPEGLSEQWKHTFNLTYGGGATTAEASSSTVDGKQVAAASTVSEPSKIAIDVFANFAQFLYDDSNPENTLGAGVRGVPKDDAFLLAWQVGAKVNFTKTVYLQVAPTLYNYTGTGDTFNRRFSGDPDFLRRTGNTFVRTAVNQTGVNSLLVYDMPMEFGFAIHDIPVRLFGDFAVNLDGDDRAIAAGHPDKGDQRYAYQIGLGVGKIKAKHDWAVSAYWQHAEQFALDPNLVDSDIFDSRVNMEGFAVTAGYALSDAVTANLTYAYGSQIDHDLGTGGTGDAFTINPLRKYSLFQADLSVKF